jgi:DNA-binding PadR family transcriptional regulator
MSQKTADQLRKLAARLDATEPPLLVEHPLADVQSGILVAVANLTPDATPGRVSQYLIDTLAEEVDYSQIHSALKRMHQTNGFVEPQAEPLVEPGKKPSTRYAITAAGFEALRSKIIRLRRLADQLEKLLERAAVQEREVKRSAAKHGKAERKAG